MSLQTTKTASTSSASKCFKRKDTTEENENKKDYIKRSFQKEWLTTYAWLKYEDGEMYCSVCKAFKKKNTLTSGSTNFRTSTLVRHIESRDHRESVIVRQSAQRMEMMNKEIFVEYCNMYHLFRWSELVHSTMSFVIQCYTIL